MDPVFDKVENYSYWLESIKLEEVLVVLKTALTNYILDKLLNSKLGCIGCFFF
jgi:hypothetical protein